MMSPVRKLSDRHPFEIYILAYALVASVPSALGFVQVPISIAQELPGWPARLWAAGLAVGSIVALIGLAWHRPPFPFVSVTGLGLEQVGLTIVGVSAVIYGVAALTSAGAPALVPASIVFAFGVACFAQVLKIRTILSTSRPAR